MSICALCGYVFHRDGEAVRLIIGGREAVVCQSCDRLEGDSGG